MADDLTDNGLTPRQHKALAALLEAPSIRQAAQASGIPEKTLYNWLKTPVFDSVYREMRRDAVQQAVAVGQQAGAAMMRHLVKLATTAKSEAVQHSAAKTVLEFSIRAVEIDDIVSRLDALEQRDATEH